MKILVVIDLQNDFINGSLGTREAEAIVPRVLAKIKSFDGRVLFTRDTHDADYLSTQEGKILPVEHCIFGSHGWGFPPQIAQLVADAPIDKPTFGSVALAERLKSYGEHESKIESITLVGLCTDICVISNALILKAFLPEVPIIVDASCCAGVTSQSHAQALGAMKLCQIEIENA